MDLNLPMTDFFNLRIIIKLEAAYDTIHGTEYFGKRFFYSYIFILQNKVESGDLNIMMCVLWSFSRDVVSLGG